MPLKALVDPGDKLLRADDAAVGEIPGPVSESVNTVSSSPAPCNSLVTAERISLRPAPPAPLNPFFPLFNRGETLAMLLSPS